jgi:hypothetical protein
MIKNAFFLLFIVIITLCSACSAPTPKPSPASSPISPIPSRVASSVPVIRLTPLPGKSALAGVVVSSSTRDHLSQTVVRLARIYWDEARKEGAFVLDGANSPGAITNEKGEFFFSNLEAADYVVVVGDIQGNNAIVSNTDGSAKTFTAAPDKILDAGTLEVPYTP